MKANEFITEKKKRRRRGPRWAAYGPGPYGGYGYYAGYSGDSGSSGEGGDGGGGGESIHREASYPGNIGMMELAKFFQMAEPDEKDQFKKLLELGKKGLAWKLVQDIVGVKLQGDEFKTDENFADGKRPQDKGDSKRHAQHRPIGTSAWHMQQDTAFPADHLRCNLHQAQSQLSTS